MQNCNNSGTHQHTYKGRLQVDKWKLWKRWRLVTVDEESKLNLGYKYRKILIFYTEILYIVYRKVKYFFTYYYY